MNKCWYSWYIYIHNTKNNVIRITSHLWVQKGTPFDLLLLKWFAIPKSSQTLLPYQVETPVLQTIWAMCQRLPQADSKPLEALSNWDEEKNCRKNTQTLPTKAWSVGCISLISHKIMKCPINPLLIRLKWLKSCQLAPRGTCTTNSVSLWCT